MPTALYGLLIALLGFTFSAYVYKTDKKIKHLEGNIKHIEEYLKNKQA